VDNWTSITYIGLLLFIFSCEQDEFEIEVEQELAGGETTIFSSGPDAYTFPLANLDDNGIAQHFLADGVFGQQFVSAPANQFGGIGPLFNQNSCEGCHIRNGRSTVPEFDGDSNSGLLLRISLSGTSANGAIIPVPGFGGQLQTKGVFGVQAEGKISKIEVSEIVEYIDGQSVVLTKPIYNITNPYISIPQNVLISPRMAPPVHGLGLLEAIREIDILQLEDEADANGDGISGRVNKVWDILEEKIAIGRFGWKAEQPTAGQQAADAAHNDIGLTNFYFEEEHCEEQDNCSEGLQESFDIDRETTDLFAFYFQTLAVPARRNQTDPIIQKGKELFSKAKCNSCHKERFITGDHNIVALSNQVIFPYTDILLHDMGNGLGDNRPTFLANGQEWRTAPLWGIGLTQIVNERATFLHDGRAKTLEEAILWHGGEGEESRDLFMKFNSIERSELIAFVNSL
jgi:CxxC motif-containing protein (DUF1111 family)